MVEGQARRWVNNEGVGGQERPEVTSEKPPHIRAHRPTWQAAIREGLDHLTHPWHNPHEAKEQSRPW